MLNNLSTAADDAGMVFFINWKKFRELKVGLRTSPVISTWEQKRASSPLKLLIKLGLSSKRFNSKGLDPTLTMVLLKAEPIDW